jgi:hypothetical protein
MDYCAPLIGYDIERMTYVDDPKTVEYWQRKHPGMPDQIWLILALTAQGIKTKEYKSLLKKWRKKEASKPKMRGVTTVNFL